MQHELLHHQEISSKFEISSKLEQEKQEFLSIMGKKSLDEVWISYMDMKNTAGQVTVYKKRVSDLEKRLGEVKQIGDMLREKLDQELTEFELPKEPLPHYTTQKAEIQPLLSQKLTHGDEW